MKLTRPERLILWNLFELRSLLEKKDAEHWRRMADIVGRGYEILFSDLPDVDELMPEKRGRLVLDVLELYRRFGDYLRANPDDTDVSEHAWSRFQGFDGNEEGDLMALCRFLVHEQGKFAEQVPNAKATDDFDSHAPTADRYQKLLSTWRTRGGPPELSADDARAILELKAAKKEKRKEKRKKRDA